MGLVHCMVTTPAASMLLRQEPPKTCVAPTWRAPHQLRTAMLTPFDHPPSLSSHGLLYAGCVGLT